MLIKITVISIPETQGQSVSINLEFKRATLTGIRHATIHNIKYIISKTFLSGRKI